VRAFAPAEYRHVNYLWDEDHASSLDAVERLVYRSKLLGADQRITNTGGGKTSSKVTQVWHPFRYTRRHRGTTQEAGTVLC